MFLDKTWGLACVLVKANIHPKISIKTNAVLNISLNIAIIKHLPWLVIKSKHVFWSKETAFCELIQMSLFRPYLGSQLRPTFTTQYLSFNEDY